MNSVPRDFAVLMSDFLMRLGRESDPAADGIEFSAEDCIARASPHAGLPGHVLVEIELGSIDFEDLAEDASALLALHRFNEASDWIFTIDPDDVPVLRIVRPIAETDGAMLEKLFAFGIETASAVAVIAKRRDARTVEKGSPDPGFRIIRG